MIGTFKIMVKIKCQSTALYCQMKKRHGCGSELKICTSAIECVGGVKFFVGV